MNPRRLPLALCLATVVCTASHAQTYWVRDGGGTWYGINNWSPRDIPNTPDEFAVIELPGAYTVTISLNLEIGGISVVNPLVTVGLPSPYICSVYESFHNDGTILVNPNGHNSRTTLAFNSPVAITGGGSIRLNGVEATQHAYVASNFLVHNTLAHTIGGRGEIEAELLNDGTVVADVRGYELLLTEEPKVNNNLLLATNGGLLHVRGPVVQTGGGIVRADGGEVRLGAYSVVVGGRLETVRGGIITCTETVFDGATLDGELIVPLAYEIAVRGGGLTNEGLIQLHSDNNLSPSTLHVLETCTLRGSGRLQLNGQPTADLARIEVTDGAILIHEAGHSIGGSGEIRGSVQNLGRIAADGSDASIRISGGEMLNHAEVSASGGAKLVVAEQTIQQIGSGTLSVHAGVGRFEAGSTSSISGGVIAATDGGWWQREAGQTTLREVELVGELRVGPRALVIIEPPGVTNRGVIFVSPEGSSDNAELRLGPSATVSGEGEVRLHSTRSPEAARLVTDRGAWAILGPGQRLTGSGKMIGDWQVAGVIAPGPDSGRIRSNDEFMLLPSATLEIDIDGTADHDRIEGFGRIALDGTLSVSLGGNYVPSRGEEWPIVTGSSSAGRFASLETPPAPTGLIWRVRYEADRAVLIFTCTADFFPDAIIDTRDVLAYLSAWVQREREADLDHDGDVDTADFLAFLNLWTAGC